ncbi:hypothetical protein L249_4722 [Ophiocordyceps polyrhachis-furcata BCC 54312]|uniref:Methyltransferase type 12 domain-containing protein n=1 Tax=Ophiocordyceps polyrhachis-furcata BCC 54312 TaxID=1330021 RepID=A0A367L2U5_9HYPO|nr:hypothetical protein L249_4722 [Ophiocordyceps polyrhachis-furcata BCC 54312]
MTCDDATSNAAGVAIYTPFLLRIYDSLVHGLSNRLVWQCSTTKDLIPLFNSTLGRRHVDIGVGTGYLPSTALAAQQQRDLSSSPSSSFSTKTKTTTTTTTTTCESMTLIDLNPHALQTAQARILNTGTRAEIKTLKADILSPPIPFPPPDAAAGKESKHYDTVSIFYLLHCLPGPPEAKMQTVLRAVVPLLSPDGVLVGATVLGKGRRLNLLARLLLALYNRWGVFGNMADSEEVFRHALVASFRHVDAWCVGAVMLFRARGPRVVVDGGEQACAR